VNEIIELNITTNVVQKNRFVFRKYQFELMFSLSTDSEECSYFTELPVKTSLTELFIQGLGLYLISSQHPIEKFPVL